MAVIARVLNVRGEVFAVDSKGTTRRLNAGDELQEGEVIVTGPGATAELSFVGGRTLNVPEQQAIMLDASVAATGKPDATTSALSELAQKVIQALKTGDFNALLETEATAAGLTGGGNDGGSTFVQLLRLTEGDLSPNAYNFGASPVASGADGGGAPIPDPLLNPPITMLAVDDSDSTGEDSVISLTGTVLANDISTVNAAVLEVTAVRTGPEPGGVGVPGTL